MTSLIKILIIITALMVLNSCTVQQSERERMAFPFESTI